VHHDTVNAGLVGRGLDPLDWLEIADIYSDLSPVVLPYKINIDGKLVKVEYKLFYNPLTTKEKREWDNAETLVVLGDIKDAIDEGMDGMNIMAYGAEPRKVYTRRYLAAIELEMASRPGGTVVIVEQSATYDEYVGKWVVVGPDGCPKVCTFVIRINKSTHHSKLFYPDGATDAEKQEMQNAIIQWQGGLLQGPLLEGMFDNHIMNNYNDIELLRQRARTNDTFLQFYRICRGGLFTTREERESLTLNSFSRAYFRDNELMVVYEYVSKWLSEVFNHACQHSDKSKRPTSSNEVTVQHLVEYRQSRAMVASLKARKDDSSKQYRGGQFTPSQIVAGVKASVLARSDNPSKQRARSIWTIEEQEMFYNAAIVHGMGRWSKIADSIPNIDTNQVKNFGKVYEDGFPTEYAEIVIAHKAHVYNLYSEEHYNVCIETDTTYLFLSKKREEKQFECGQVRDVCRVLGCTCTAVKDYKTYRVCARHYTELL
jgi:hypothetical protein